MQEGLCHRLYGRALATQDHQWSDYPQVAQRQLAQEALAQLAQHADARQPRDPATVHRRPLQRFRVAEFHGWILLEAPAAQPRPDDFARSRAALTHEQRLPGQIARRDAPLAEERMIG